MNFFAPFRIALRALAANTLRSSQAVIDLFGPGYTVVEDKLLGQPNWPTYWTLLVHKKPS